MWDRRPGWMDTGDHFYDPLEEQWNEECEETRRLSLLEDLHDEWWNTVDEWWDPRTLKRIELEWRGKNGE